MRRLAWLAWCVGLLLPMVCFAAAAPAPSGRPNFVVIIADDLGAGEVGAFGHPVVRTPNIDRLAQHGTRFDNAFLTTSSCTASRASIRLGRYPHNTGAENLNDEVPGNQRLGSSYLREAGYYTASVGKWHEGEALAAQLDRRVIQRGESGAEDWVTELHNRPRDRPFYFWLASLDPHLPYAPLQPDGPYQPEDAVILPTYYDSPGARQNLAQYYTEISRLDDNVGRVVEELKAQGVLENTYIFFLSDNGAPMPRAKTTLYDAGIRMPLIVRAPGAAKAGVSAAMVSSVDITPTLLALAGVPVPDAMQGSEFSALLTQPQQKHRDVIFAEQHNHGFPINKRAVRSPDYLYIRNIGENKHNCLLEMQPMGREMHQAFKEKKLTREQSLCFVREHPQEELYDVHKDPYQVHNLAGDPAHEAVRLHLRSLLDAQARATGDDSYF